MIEANWLGAYVGRRVAIFVVHVDFIQRWLTTGTFVEAGWQVVEGVQPGARLLAVVPVLHTGNLAFLFEHADFAVVQEHAPAYQPRSVTFKSLDPAPDPSRGAGAPPEA